MGAASQNRFFGREFQSVLPILQSNALKILAQVSTESITPRINSLAKKKKKKKLYTMELNREMKLKFFVYVRRKISGNYYDKTSREGEEK